MKQQILIHGADNDVGLALCARLIAGEWATPLPVGTLDFPELARAAATAEGVVHCITGDARAIVRGARALYDVLAGTARRCRVVHLSSMSVYGAASGPVGEDSELRADLGAYSRAQRDAELLARTHPDVAILRPGAEYGPGCSYWTRQVGQLLLAGRLGDLGTAGDGRCNLLYIEDLLDAMERALHAPRLEQHRFNLADPSEGTWNDYFIEFALALRAVPVRRITARRLSIETRVLAPLLKALQLGSRIAHLPAYRLPPMLSPSMLFACRQDISLQVGSAESLLDMHWTDRQQALAHAAADVHRWLEGSGGSRTTSPSKRTAVPVSDTAMPTEAALRANQFTSFDGNSTYTDR